MEETAAFALEQGLRAVARLPGQRCRWDSGAKQQAGPGTAGAAGTLGPNSRQAQGLRGAGAGHCK